MTNQLILIIVIFVIAGSIGYYFAYQQDMIAQKQMEQCHAKLMKSNASYSLFYRAGLIYSKPTCIINGVIQ